MFKTSRTHIRRALCAAAVLPMIWSGALRAEAAAQARTESKLPFTLLDSIGMTRIADPDLSVSEMVGTAVKMSPDGSRFFIVTAKGDLATGQRLFELRVFEAAAVLAQLSQPARRRAELARTVSTFACETDEPCIAQARWLDRDRIAFIGRRAAGPGQVFVAGADGAGPRQLTHSRTPVAQFDMTPDGRSIAFYAEVDRTEGWAERERNGIVVKDETLFDLTSRGRAGMRVWYRLFLVADGAPPRAAQVPVLKEVQDPFVLKLALSPDGAKLITELELTRMPRGWLAFDQQRDEIVGKAAIREESEEALASHYRSTQFFMVDMRSGSARPILDAPSETFGSAALWTNPDHALLLNTHVPASATPGRSTRGLAVAEVDAASGQVRLVHDLAATPGGRSHSLAGQSWNAGSQTLRFETRTRGEKARACQAYVREPQHWRATSCAAGAGRLKLWISQALDRAPDLEAEDLQTRRRARITDLNPSFRRRAFGRVEALNWDDAAGRRWEGALIYPTDYVKGRRYPLVVQTHGFDPSSFLVDGPNDAANGFAAQPLANLGFVVLQLDDFAHDLAGKPGELEAATMAYESVVDRLSAQGLVDPEKVALTAWSRTGFYVEHALTHSNLRYAAVSLSDASSLTYSRYLSFFNFFAAYNRSQETFLGGTPWDAAGLENWRTRATSFNFSRIEAPVRVEGVGELGPMWELLAGLRSLKKPVELVWYPESAHLIVRPRHRYRSQQGTIDWYRFWLQGVERTTPTPGSYETPELLTKQNANWRMMREERGE